MLWKYSSGEEDNSGHVKPAGDKAWLSEACQCSKMFLPGGSYLYD